jgi:hypothetical protein
MFGNYDEISNSELSAIIDEWIKGRNAERNRAILKRRMIDGICYEPLAEEFNLSVKQVQNIVYKNEYTIYRHIWHI